MPDKPTLKTCPDKMLKEWFDMAQAEMDEAVRKAGDATFWRQLILDEMERRGMKILVEAR